MVFMCSLYVKKSIHDCSINQNDRMEIMENFKDKWVIENTNWSESTNSMKGMDSVYDLRQCIIDWSNKY